VTTLALGQLTGPPDGGSENRARSVRLASAAFDRGADIVVLPELIVPGYDLRAERVGAAAEPLDGDTVEAWAAVASDAGGYIAGGFAERDGTAIYNSAVLVGPDGVVLHYRKLHLFADEKLAFTPGDRGLPVAQTPLGAIGLCVCYDLRFVETLRILALQGAQLVCVPTAWVPGFDASRWDRDGYCSQARAALVQANLNQVFVACASQAGAQEEQEFLGSSILGDPFGRCVGGPLAGDRDELVLVEIDLDDATRAQDRGGGVRPRADRRTDVYALAVGEQRL
jgi:N-carbamoylputrescine amidase